MIDSKWIRDKALDGLFKRLGPEWLERKGKKIMLSSIGNATDFVIEIECQSDRRHDDYDCYLVAVFYWQKFSALFRDFDQWYNTGSDTIRRKSPREFMRISFLRIDGDFVKDRGPTVVANDHDLNLFINKCENDFRGKVGRWLKMWFNWSSSLQVMEENGYLCGAWRNIAYYCLMNQVNGKDAACEWIKSIEHDVLPNFQSNQVEYLNSKICRQI